MWLLLRQNDFAHPVIVPTVTGRSVPVPIAFTVPFSVARDVRVHIVPAADDRPAPWWWSVSIPVSIPVPIGPTTNVVIDRGRGPWRKRVWATLPGWQSLSWSETTPVRCRRVPATINAVTIWVAATVEPGVRSARTIVRPTPHRSALRSGGQGSLSIVELSAVKLVALLHDRQIAGLSWEGSSVKIGVLKGVDRVDSLLPVKAHQFSEERDGTHSVSGV